MKKTYSKYFWNLNEKALEEIEQIFQNSNHPKFKMHMVTFLSRCQNPKELFALVKKDSFIKFWPKVKKYWKKVSGHSDFIDWWQTICEQLLQGKGLAVKRPSGKPLPSLLKVGEKIKKARIEKGFSQKELALQAGMKQPDISKIEEGKKNITLLTLSILCKVLEIKKIEMQ